MGRHLPILFWAFPTSQPFLSPPIIGLDAMVTQRLHDCVRYLPIQ